MYLWFEDVWDRGHLPLAVCFLAFIVTFATTRLITRLIRTGRGPFKNNVSASGVHVHHAVPGVFLMVVGAFAALAVDLHSPWSIIAGLFVGIGTALVLDEFALILHLDDVYWSDKGRVSFEIVMLAVAVLGLMLVGANPLGFLDEERRARVGDQRADHARAAGGVPRGVPAEGQVPDGADRDLPPASGVDRRDSTGQAGIMVGTALVLAEAAPAHAGPVGEVRRPVGSHDEVGRRRCRWQADQP